MIDTAKRLLSEKGHNVDEKYIKAALLLQLIAKLHNNDAMLKPLLTGQLDGFADSIMSCMVDILKSFGATKDELIEAVHALSSIDEELMEVAKEQMKG